MSRQRSLRIDYVKDVLHEKGMVTAQELATDLRTSRRTIYRYMEQLRREGFGVEACPGSSGGFRVVDKSCEGSPSIFSDEEALALMIAGLAVAEHNLLPNSDKLESALERIRDTLTPEQWSEIQETMPNVSIMVGKLYCREDTERWLDCITEAIASRQSLMVNYHSFNRDQADTRKIDPYHLLFQGGAWYVLGYCHLRCEIRTFRVDRIRDLHVLPEEFERPRSFSLNAYLGAAWGIMKGDRCKIKVLFYPPASRLIVEGVWHPSQQVTVQPDHTVVFEAVVDGLEEVERWILTFGDGAEVLEPAELRRRVFESTTRASARYSHDKE